MQYSHHRQSGAVSLFVVIFATLLLTVVAVSFIRLMIAEQQRASTVDLAQSAYDSAQAGVEDAKRAILKYELACKTSVAACGVAATSLAQVRDTPADCNKINQYLGMTSEAANRSETLIQQTTDGDKVYSQAYTCVLVTLLTEDYIGTLAANTAELIPLNATAGYDTITIQWYTKEDAGGATTASLATDAITLLSTERWEITRPSVMRAQLMQVGSSFTLDQFDSMTTTSPTQSNANTVFLYPVSTNGFSSSSFTGRDTRQSAATPPATEPNPGSIRGPVKTTCQSANLAAGGYACEISLTIPTAVGETSINNRTAFLRLGAFYNATHYRVTMSNSDPTQARPFFNGVQPEIDSTGRATDLFRRVLSRVKLGADFPYPNAAVGVSGNFCKNFVVTNDTNEYATINNDTLQACSSGPDIEGPSALPTP